MAEKFEAWGIVELMGHQRTCGRLTEQSIGGSNLLRVDIPNGEGFRTVFYGASAIYALHITDEAAARTAAGNMGARPTYAYELEHAIRQASPNARITSQVDVEEDGLDESPDYDPFRA